MDTKLTLNVDTQIIGLAKDYAKSHKISLSQLIETYLSSLVTKKSNELTISPLVESLSGVIKLDDDFDLNQSYTNALLEKYK